MKEMGSTRRLQQADETPVKITLPFKDQRSANKLREQLRDLSWKINTKIHPVFTSRKIKDELKAKEPKPPILLSTSKSLYISLSVICVMKIMLALQADTYINMWRSTNDWWSAIMWENNMETSHVKSQRTLGSWGSARAKSIVWFLRCFLFRTLSQS